MQTGNTTTVSSNRIEYAGWRKLFSPPFVYARFGCGRAKAHPYSAREALHHWYVV